MTAAVAGASDGQWLFGQVDFTSGSRMPLHWPVAVRATASSLQSDYSFNNVNPGDTVTIKDIESAAAITDFTASVFGMVPAEEYTGDIWQDPTPILVRDGLTEKMGEYVIKKVLTEANARLVAALYATTAPDLDLYIWDNTHETMACTSAGETSLEYCNIDNPEAAEYWIIVQNYTAMDPTGKNPDTFTLGTAVVPDTVSSTTTVAVSPAGETVPAGEPFDIAITLRLPGHSGHWYGGFIAGADSDNPTSIGRANIDLFVNIPRRAEEAAARAVSSAPSSNEPTAWDLTEHRISSILPAVIHAEGVSYSNSLVLCLDSAKPFRHRVFFADVSDSCGASALLGCYGEVLENSALFLVPA